MDKKLLQQLQTHFDQVAQKMPNEDIEFWFARDLQTLLGYSRWENFLVAIERAIISCKTMKYKPVDHFRGVTKMVSLGSGSQREVDDIGFARIRSQGDTALLKN
jgi:DNA-damage-inducible protein D